MTTPPAYPLRAEDILESLTRVIDLTYGINIVDLGIVYGIEFARGVATIQMTLTTPGCPLHDSIEEAVHRVLETRHPGITGIHVNLVWEPAWDVDRIMPAGKAELGW